MKKGIAAGALLLLTASIATGQPPPASAFLSEYTSTSWSEKDGLPSSRIRSIAQDGQGYLWLGTDAGLVRFDGTRFVSWDEFGPATLRKAPIAVVCIARDRSIWVAFVDGSVSRITSRDVTNYDHRQGLGTAAVSDLLEDRSGVMWLATESGLYRFRGDAWELWSTAAHGLPAGSVSAALSAQHGDLLVALPDALYALRPSSTTFSLVQYLDRPLRDLAEDASGAIWLTDPVFGFRMLRTSGSTRRISAQGAGVHLLIDHRGRLWIGTGGQGVWCIEAPNDPQRATVLKASILTGLSGNGVLALVEDRDGNIWVGNSGGLNRIAPKRAWSITEPSTVRAVQSAADGRIWVGMDGEVVSLSMNGHRSGSPALTVPSGEFPAIDVDRDGVLWMASNASLTQVDRAGARRWDLDHPGPLKQIQTITSDAHGGLWIYDRRHGLLRFHAGQLDSFRATDAFNGAQVVTSYTDSRGRAWFSFDDGTIAAATVAGLKTFGVHEGLDGGMYQAIYEDDQGVLWLAGTGALTRSISDERFQTFHAANGIPAEPLTAILKDDANNLWIAGTSGIYRIMRQEIDKVRENGSYRVQYALLDTSDGVAGHPMATAFGQRLATRASDGRLWFVTGRGLTAIDPHQALQTHSTPPVPHVEQIVANGQPIRAGANVHLPPRTQRIDIQYSIVELTAPHKTRFRYRLDGIDPDWTDVGAVRQANYVNLAPGEYRFHLAATDAYGNWTESQRAFTFDIAPPFYNTSWFLGVSLCLLSAFAWGIWQLRLREVHRQFAVRLEERARLSRELHDTLLQNMVGIALQCEVIAGDADRSAPVSRNDLLRLRRLVERYVRELRQSIWALRSPQTPLADLAGALQQAGERTIEGTHIEFEFAVAGFPRPCGSNIEDQLLRIGQEAIMNAVRHANASHVKMELRYEESMLGLRVSDDGHGFDVRSAGKANGHYGLIGMRERAASVGAILHVTSSARGTDVEAAVPIATAVEASA